MNLPKILENNKKRPEKIFRPFWVVAKNRRNFVDFDELSSGI